MTLPAVGVWLNPHEMSRYAVVDLDAGTFAGPPSYHIHINILPLAVRHSIFSPCSPIFSAFSQESHCNDQSKTPQFSRRRAPELGSGVLERGRNRAWTASQRWAAVGFFHGTSRHIMAVFGHFMAFVWMSLAFYDIVSHVFGILWQVSGHVFWHFVASNWSCLIAKRYCKV